MELQFEKKLIPHMRTVLRQTQTQEQTQEVRLPEDMPDIGRVISSWGQVLVRGKEWRSSGMNVSGGVMVWVLYAPEDGSEPRCLEAWLPFQTKWEFLNPEPDGAILAYPLLNGVDARSTSARKMMVRAGVSVLGTAMCQDDAPVYEPTELPDDVCVLKNTYPMCLPTEAGEKAFSLEETLPFPESMPMPVRLLRYELRPEVTEQRLLADKLIFRGTAALHVLYADADGQMHSWDTELPFSQYAELDRDYSDEAKAEVCPLITNLEMELDAAAGITVKAGLTGQYTVFECSNIQLVEDAYSPVRRVDVHKQQLQLPMILDVHSEMRTAEQVIPEDAGSVMDIAFYPEHPRVYHEEGNVTTELSGAFQVLCRNPEGQLHSQMSRWEDSWNIPAASTVKTEAMLTHSGKCSAGGTNVSARVQLDARMVGQAGLMAATGLELGEVQEPDPNRPSLILCPMGADRLWDIAKRTGSTVEAIVRANNLQQEPEMGKVLLIPVP